MNLNNYVEAENFQLELAKAAKKIVPKYFNLTNINSEKFTENETDIKTIVDLFGNLNTVIDDIELALYFLGKDRELILEHYPDLESQRKYFNYHYENYYIRLITLGDILGKIGKLCYGLKKPNLKNTYAHNFKTEAENSGYQKISSITEKLLIKLEHYKEHRHSKVHTGDADTEALSQIVIWEDIDKIIGSKSPDILNEYTNKQIEAKIDNLKKNIIDIIEIINEFLEETTEKLKEISSKI